jgi:Holliday junction resolvase RusA-like endonuclease
MSDTTHLRSIEFWIPGPPVGKQDMQVTTHIRYKDKVTHEWKVRTLEFPIRHKPPETTRAEKVLRTAARAAMQRLALEPFTGPVLCVVTAVFLQPEGWSEKKKAANAWHAEKPDSGNILELLDDACQKPRMKKGRVPRPEDLRGVLWDDDKQLAVQAIRKVYGAREGLLVTVRELDQACLDVGEAQGLSWPMTSRVADAVGAATQLGLAVGGEG